VSKIRVLGYPVRKVSQRLGASAHSLYKWLRLFAEPAPKLGSTGHEAENRRLKQELVRVTEERDIPKKWVSHGSPLVPEPWRMRTSRASPNEVRVHSGASSRVPRQGHVPGAADSFRFADLRFSGFYTWLKKPLSHRALEDARQTELIRQAWCESDNVYGYRKLTHNLRSG
jgi:transposase-like protein